LGQSENKEMGMSFDDFLRLFLDGIGVFLAVVLIRQIIKGVILSYSRQVIFERTKNPRQFWIAVVENFLLISCYLWLGFSN
jgi:hypothetical protein